MPLSGVPIISLRTLVAFCNWLSSAKAGAQNVRNRKTMVSLFIWSLLVLYLHLLGGVSHLPVHNLWKCRSEQTGRSPFGQIARLSRKIQLPGLGGHMETSFGLIS